MDWSSLSRTLDQTCVAAFGIVATHTHGAGVGTQITGIVQSPNMAEDFVPGLTQGTSIVRFFVRFTGMTPLPIKGDHVTINGVGYDLFEVAADVEGGAILKLRRTS